MERRLVQADNQICYRALCGIERQAQAEKDPRRSLITRMALAALRRVSKRRGHCTDCPYRGLCHHPDEDALVDARAVDWHVSAGDPSGRRSG